MKQFFARNITGPGRFIRFLIGCAFIAAGWWLWSRDQKVLAVLAFIGGGFTWFEALRGWCFMRACGIKTRW